MCASTERSSQHSTTLIAAPSLPEISHADAIARARAELELDDDIPAEAVQIRRLDPPSEAYFLVTLGEPETVIAVATIGASTGAVGTAAVLSGHGPQLMVDASRARALAGASASAGATLVWRPSRASRSPLYPLWEVEHEGVFVYVDQQENVWADPDHGSR